MTTTISTLRPTLRAWAERVLPHLPYGQRVLNNRMKGAILDGRQQMLVPVDALTRAYTNALQDPDLPTAAGITYFEAGVFAGQSLAVWHEVTSGLGIETRSFGADSFEGLPPSVQSDEGNWDPGAFSCPREVAEWNLERLHAPVDRIRLIEGWFDETLTADLAAEVGPVHVAMLDADAYSSTVPVLDFLTPLLHDPAYLIFDDWFQGGNYDPATGKSVGIGVERAFAEWRETNPEWVVEPVDTYTLRDDLGPAGRVVKVGTKLNAPIGAPEPATDLAAG